jgi:hypothetical protein
MTTKIDKLDPNPYPDTDSQHWKKLNGWEKNLIYLKQRNEGFQSPGRSLQASGKIFLPSK